MALPFFNWSKTAASNATADSTVNWAEGQSPSSVNDSARAMMASTAAWRDDISGTITTGGSSTAYTLTSNQVFDSLAHMNGAMISFIPHATNGASATLNVDGLGAKPLRFSPSVAAPAGTLILGAPYTFVYNSSDAAFYLHNFSTTGLYATGGVLTATAGTLMLFQQTSAPTGWTKQTTHNDKALRVVSGTASSGGTSPFSTVFGLTATSGHTLILSELPSSVQATGGANAGPTVTSPNIFTLPNGNIGATDQAHTHPIELRVQYVDLIIASKD